MSRRITAIIGIVLSILLLYYALRDVSVAELLEHLGDANFWLLGAATAVATFTFFLRAVRWNVLLYAAQASIPLSSRFATVCIGFMLNNLLPARLGEFARAYSLSRIEPVALTAVLGSLVVERLLDALVMAGFLVPAFFLGGAAITAAGSLRELFTALVLLVAAGFVVLVVMVRFPGWFLRTAERWSHRLAPDRVADRVTGILASFIAGLGALGHAHVFLRALAWSLVVWGTNACSFYLGFLAFDIRGPGAAGAMLLQSTIGFAVAIPSTPGFFGPFEAAARAGLELYGVQPSLIISFAVGYHVMTFIPITLMGLWYMRKLGFSREELEHSEELVEAAKGEPRA